jgi:hypothetical protein
MKKMAGNKEEVWISGIRWPDIRKKMSRCNEENSHI